MRKLPVFSAIILPLLFFLGAQNTAAFQKPTRPNRPDKPELVRVFVRFKIPPREYNYAQIRYLGGSLRHTYHNPKVVAINVPENSLSILEKNPQIELVEPDIKVQTLATELENSWGYTKINAEGYHQNNITGQGVGIALIDTGFDYTHPELLGINSGGYDFVNQDSDPMDDNGHGTHIAGIIGAAVNGQGRIGIAPGVNIYNLKVLDDRGVGYWSDILEALEWAEKRNVPIANLSFGSSSYPGTIVEDTLRELNSKGMVIVAAAGNTGNSSGSGNSILYPAKFASTIAVGATDKFDARAPFSSTGSELDLTAPGVNIYSTQPNGGYAYYSGTSMAAPFVAGATALLYSSTQDTNGNGRTNDELRTALFNKTIDLGATGKDNLFGLGRLNLTGENNNYEENPTHNPPSNPSSSIESIVYSTSIRRSRVKLKVHLNLIDEKGNPIKRARVSYTVLRNDKVISSKRKRTNAKGVIYQTISSRAKPGCYSVVVKGVNSSSHPWDKITPPNGICL